MTEHQDIYKNETERYQALVSFEDFNHNLSTAINRLIGTGCPSILETGAGTGRVTEILAPLAGKLAGFDISPSMLLTANLKKSLVSNAFSGFSAADHRWLPVCAAGFDWVVSGWSVCYLVSWQKESWKTEVDRALIEFIRTLNDDGNILLIESLGTGRTEPDPPSHLREYLEHLDFLGFSRQAIRTDYKFPDLQTANSLVEFFFGREMLQYIKKSPLPVLPECTGLWSISRQKLITRLSV